MGRENIILRLLARSRQWAKFTVQLKRTWVNNHADFIQKEKKLCSSPLFFTRFIVFYIYTEEKKINRSSVLLIKRKEIERISKWSSRYTIYSSIKLRLSIWEIQQTTRATSQKREGECASINTMVDVGDAIPGGTRATKPTNFADVVGVDEEAATLRAHVFLDIWYTTSQKFFPKFEL